MFDSKVELTETWPRGIYYDDWTIHPKGYFVLNRDLEEECEDISIILKI